ncbi:fatty acyl-CoA reductase 1-like [Uloborus diversus]|uniref:fatty acyl-CoA reductase 1-like n=1 Tax=Uloborus diversus TaxID=327109 RepID=UPI0024094C94|nr:fatty acyl-CoA reductase 1-like [Uloborus diversus]
MEKNSEQKKPSIPELFKGKCIFITGATGFLGKVLLEKLLRSCPDIQEILVLLRPREPGTVESRLSDLLKHKALLQAFDRIREECEHVLKKVKPLDGDLVAPNLGLSDEDLKKVINDVSFFFHCAANVRFDDEPRSTMRINLLGVKNVLKICHEIIKLEAFVHVSTAYAFCNQAFIDERIYREATTPDQIIEILSWMSNRELRSLCEFYLEGRPSLYHFSKALAENLVCANEPPLPAIIVRPSIVTASVSEPFPGWIDNYNGPSGFLMVCGKGVVRTLLVRKNVNADWVPVDTVANTLIVAAHYIAVKSKLPDSEVKLECPSKVPIVNCTCPNSNIISWMKVVSLCLPYLIKYPSSEVWSKPGGTVTSCYVHYKICQIFHHYIPAYITDSIAFIFRKKPRFVNMYHRIHGVMNHLQYYTNRKFFFLTRNMRKLVEDMEPADAEIFPIDQNKLDWEEYMKNYVLGVRRYYLKESDSTLESSRRKMMRYYYLWLTLKCASAIGVLYLFKKHHWKLWLCVKFVLPLPSSKSILEYSGISVLSGLGRRISVRA